MRALLVRMVGVVCVVCSMGIVAQAADLKVGYVDFQRALNEVQEGRQAKAELQKAFQQKQKEIDAMQRELETMQKGLEKDRLILSADALQDKENAYRKKFIELTQTMNGAKAELAQREADTTSGILSAMRKTIQKIATDEHYDLVLERSQDVVLYSPPKSDITADVISAYNKLPKSQRRGK